MHNVYPLEHNSKSNYKIVLSILDRMANDNGPSINCQNVESIKGDYII